jgi:hypothetical protein
VTLGFEAMNDSQRADSKLDLVELEGAVEYKSLPSGLHNVKEDLV